MQKERKKEEEEKRRKKKKKKKMKNKEKATKNTRKPTVHAPGIFNMIVLRRNGYHFIIETDLICYSGNIFTVGRSSLS